MNRIVKDDGLIFCMFPNVIACADQIPYYAYDFVKYGHDCISNMHFWHVDEAKTFFELTGWTVIDIVIDGNDFWVKAKKVRADEKK